MKRLQVVLLLLFVGWIASGCGISRKSARPANAPAPNSDTTSAPEKPSPSSPEPRPAVTGSMIEAARGSLMDAYNKWEGTPYRLGGSSQNGVDCSQLMKNIFDEYFDVDLPNTTRTQLNEGKSIRRKAIRTGDLIFFRTGRKTLHVGVAVNKGEFLHASTSNGVMISKLGNSYWRSRYLGARRVL